MTPPAEPHNEALHRSALETLRRADKAGVSVETVREMVAERREQIERKQR